MTKDGEVEIVAPFNLYAGRDTSVYALTDFDESKTAQEFKDECDVNNIMSRYLKTGTVPVYADRQPFFVDAIDYPSYQEMQNILIASSEAFAALPAAVRERFGNDPAKFVEFASDDANVDELRKLGLLSPEAIERLDAARAAEAVDRSAKEPGAAPKAARQADKEASPAGKDSPTQ